MSIKLKFNSIILFYLKWCVIKICWLTEEPRNPCFPSPCGPNTVCRVSNGVAVCECIAGFTGSPMTSGCRPECVISADCPRNRACVNNKCVDPCPGVCGYRATCQVINHSPVCSCPPPLLGDPFTECKDSPREYILPFTHCSFTLK